MRHWLAVSTASSTVLHSSLSSYCRLHVSVSASQLILCYDPVDKCSIKPLTSLDAGKRRTGFRDFISSQRAARATLTSHTSHTANASCCWVRCTVWRRVSMSFPKKAWRLCCGSAAKTGARMRRRKHPANACGRYTIILGSKAWADDGAEV